MRRITPLLLLALLAGCGARAELKPMAGHSLPVAPVGRGDQTGANDLLNPGTQARPSRNVELQTRSQERGDDPYDLPPSK